MQSIESKLRANFEDAQLLIRDKSDGCGTAYQVIIVSEKFGEIKLLDR